VTSTVSHYLLIIIIKMVIVTSVIFIFISVVDFDDGGVVSLFVASISSCI
jgi:hypothetical protein